MTGRDFVRLSVVKTNPYWPFSVLNKIPYKVAIQSFLRRIRRFPEIKSVYLRHGLLRNDWIPAISDIDLTVVTRKEVSGQEEYEFLKSFWREFESVKQNFPMLGEIDILDEQQFVVWRKFSIRGYEAKNWLLIYGEGMLENRSIHSESVLWDSLDYAFLHYTDVFLRRLFQKTERSPLFDFEMRRQVSKILYYADYNTEVCAQVDSLNVSSLYVLILEKFEEVLSRHIFSSENTESRISVASELERELGEFSKYVDSVVIGYTRDVVILQKNVDAAHFPEFLTALQQIFSDRQKEPAIVSKRMFAYMMQIFDPFLFTQLKDYGKILHGSDPFISIQAPEMASFTRAILLQTPNVLLFPQTALLVDPQVYSGYSERELDSMLEHALFIKIYDEKGFCSSSHEELLQLTRDTYPDYFDRLSELKASRENVNTFLFWKELAREICRLQA